MGNLVREDLASDFIGKMSKTTGIRLAIGVNTYIENHVRSVFCNILIDPSSLNDEEESRLEVYAKQLGLEVRDEWNDWGRFVKLTKSEE